MKSIPFSILLTEGLKEYTEERQLAIMESDYKEHASTLTIEVCVPVFAKEGIQLLCG
ncbi:hypothetical protein OAQ34_01925 [Opitutales bacterium]|nr:hypothetical protein [Opitutales bacterium]